MTQRLFIRNFRDVGPACVGKQTTAERAKAIIDLAESLPIDGYFVTPEVVVSSDDPIHMAMTLLIYGTAVPTAGMPL